MDKIIIHDLEAHYCVGVPDEEREAAQRLLICVEMEWDIRAAAEADDLSKTINYYAVTQALLTFGSGRSWKLIETLAVDIASLVLGEFGAKKVRVEVKKFIIPEAKFVAVRIEREGGGARG